MSAPKPHVGTHWQDGELFVGAEPARLIVARASARGWIRPMTPAEVKAAVAAAEAAEQAQQRKAKEAV